MCVLPMMIKYSLDGWHKKKIRLREKREGFGSLFLRASLARAYIYMLFMNTYNT